MRFGWALAIACTVALLVRPTVSRACGAFPPATPAALPPTGSTGVSTTATLFVTSDQIPNQAVLRAGDVVLPYQLMDLGPGMGVARMFGYPTRTRYWALQAALLPSTEHVLTMPGAAGELTRFTTGPGSLKETGTAPTVKTLSLWRVRYDRDEIGSGSCVFAEHHGFISFELEPAQTPGVPAEQVLYVLRLSPKHGGADQTFAMRATDSYRGSPVTAEANNRPYGLWHPELEDGRAYCLTVTAMFAGGSVGLQSAPVCTTPREVNATDGAGGCSFGRSGSPGALLTGIAAMLATRRKTHRSATAR